MPRIFRVPTSNNPGFSLIEALVAVAIVALGIAAVTTTILISAKTEQSAHFYRQALIGGEIMQSRAYGLSDGNGKIPNMEEEFISQDPSGRIRDWQIITIRSIGDGRRVTFAFGGTP
ncbi:MAG TPA: prepilin-type N-terminal cleavage/methylation domain-containing protein [Kiritimatiellia bacterium]|nr:prepilin-type N-terminal cleavage/methylation domain-containing protein [Kiritimatiellia bacterium]